jgi:hypothetical protein
MTAEFSSLPLAGKFDTVDGGAGDPGDEEGLNMDEIAVSSARIPTSLLLH